MTVLVLILINMVFAPMLGMAKESYGQGQEIFIDRATYQPFFREKGETDKVVGPLFADKTSVTNIEFLDFLKKHPQWSKSKIQPIFTDAFYLAKWSGDFEFNKEITHHPVVRVSWFVARKYCASLGKRLPTVAEWEYLSDAQNPDHLQLILDWYAQSGSELRPVGKRKKNKFGLYDMHGLIWELVEDFSSVILRGDSRGTNENSAANFCGAGSLNAKDPTEYATFMRYAFRSSLKGAYTSDNLGFRCVRDAKKADRSH